MPLYRTFGCPRDGCHFEWHEHGRVVHMDESWTPLDDENENENDTNTTTTGSESAA